MNFASPNQAPRRNIELKARCRDLTKAAAAARAVGASPTAVLNQLDTYFHCPNGRLKLREVDGRSAELIWYARPDSTNFRGSDYYVVPITQPAHAKSALTAALGVRGEVRKRRELLLWHNVRIHLDRVDQLGDFVEFEAVIGPDDDEVTAHERLATLTAALSIQSADRVAVSYSDLLGL